MKKTKKIAIFLAATMLLPTVASAAVMAPVETNAPSVENFDTVSADDILETQWIGNTFGQMYLTTWRGTDTGFDYIGIKNANAVDTTLAEDDKALYLKDPENYDNGVEIQLPKTTLQKGEIYTMSFDYAQIGNDANQKLLLMLYSDTENGKAYYYGNQSNANDRLFGATVDFFEIKGASSEGVEYYGPAIQPGVFENYKIVIDTENEDYAGRQTITYYKNGVQCGNPVILYTVHDGAASTEPISYAQPTIYPHTIVDCYIDNIEWSVTNPDSTSKAEDFERITYEQSYTSYSGAMLGDTIRLYQGSNIAGGYTIDGAELDDALADNGKVLKFDTVMTESDTWGQDIMFSVPVNETLEKGDIYSFSMEYYSNEASGDNNMFIFLNQNTILEWADIPGDGVGESPKYEFLSVLRQDANAVKTTQAILKKYKNAMYMCNDDGGAKWYTNDGLHRYDIILDTCDPDYYNRQTIAFYYDGVLQEKGIFYELDENGNAKTTPLTEITYMGVRLNSFTDAAFAFDNIWSLKTSRNLETTIDEYKAGDVTVSLGQPTIYEPVSNAKVIMAEYDDEGYLVNVDIKTPSANRALAADFKLAGTGHMVKFLMWDGTSIEPIVDDIAY